MLRAAQETNGTSFSNKFTLKFYSKKKNVAAKFFTELKLEDHDEQTQGENIKMTRGLKSLFIHFSDKKY